MKLQPYETEHAPEFYRTYLEPECANFWRHVKMPLSMDDFHNIGKIMGAVVLTVVDDGKVMGFILVQAVVETTAILGIVLLPEYQHSDNGRSALEIAMNWLRERNYHKAQGMVADNRIGFKKLLSEIGFREVGVLNEERCTHDGWRDEYLMEIIL